MRVLLLAVALALVAPLASAHDGVDHPTRDEALAHLGGEEGTPALPFPVDIDLRFDLVDHHGNRMTEADLAGRPVALFFGYVSCEAICSVAVPRLTEALNILGPHGTDIVPVVITVDPVHDTPEAMATGLARWGDRLVGLTGSPEALAAARAVFQVEADEVATTPDGKPIYAHGSFIYLIGPDGRVRTLVPPILGPERVAYLMGRYLVDDQTAAVAR